MNNQILRKMLGEPRLKPYVSPNKGKIVLTPQKFDRRVLTAVRNGADTAVKLLETMKEYDAGDIRMSFERLVDQKKVEVTPGGMIQYLAGGKSG